MNTLEEDALEVLSRVKFLKNSFQPINRIPQDVLSLIPDYSDKRGWDEHLITLTHVCHRWRDVFTSRSTLWTYLNFKNVDKTRVYIQRSKSSPLKIFIQGYGYTFSNDAFSLVIPHLHKLKSLVIRGGFTSDVFKHFHFQAPLLEELTIKFTGLHDLELDDEIFNRDLSSLHKLTLDGVTTNLPWKNLADLRFFVAKFRAPGLGITQLLDFFESAPLLHTIELKYEIPSSSDAPPKRMVPLRHLNTLRIAADSPHSTLLNHLSIPTRASLIQEFNYSGSRFPLSDHLPESSINLSNPSHIAAINLNLHFGLKEKSLRLAGSSGELRMLAFWEDWDDHWTDESREADCGVLRSLDSQVLLATRRISFSGFGHRSYGEADECPIFQTLSSTNLGTLVLSECDNISFIHALDPARNRSQLLLCSNLEEFTLYIKSRDQFHIEPLITMAKNRVSMGVRLPSITIVGLGELIPGGEVMRLREHVRRVEYKIDVASPSWDDLLSV